MFNVISNMYQGGDTALIIASQEGHLEVGSLLVSRGADLIYLIGKI